MSAGTVNLNNATLSVSIGYSAVVGDQFDIVSDNAAPVLGTFLDRPEGATFEISGQMFSITYQGGATGNDVVLTRVAGFDGGDGPRFSPPPSGHAAGVEDVRVAGFLGFEESTVRDSLWAARLSSSR